MNKAEYRMAYQFVRATMETNFSDLDYQVATCVFRDKCERREYQTCSCDYDAELYERRKEVIKQIRANGITPEALQIAGHAYYSHRGNTEKQRRLDYLQRRLKVASSRKIWSRGK